MSSNRYETIACDYLQTKGLIILQRNYTWPGGEIDIIAQQQHELVFVEVKFRQSQAYGSPLETITARQIKRIHNTALHFLQASAAFQQTLYRFDAIGIMPCDTCKMRPKPLFPSDYFNNFQIEWITNAF